MIKKLCFIIMLVFITITPINVNASTQHINVNTDTQPVNDIYREGVYHLNNKNYINITADLQNDSNTTLIILDDEANVQYLTRVPLNYRFTIFSISPNSIIIIVGNGELALMFEQI